MIPSMCSGGKFLAQPDRAERYHRFLAAARDGGHDIVEAPISGILTITAQKEDVVAQGDVLGRISPNGG